MELSIFLWTSLTEPLSAVAFALTPPLKLFHPCVSVTFFAVRSVTPAATRFPSCVMSPSVATIVTVPSALTLLLLEAVELSPITTPPSVSRNARFFTYPRTFPMALFPLSRLTSNAPPGRMICSAFTEPAASVCSAPRISISVEELRVPALCVNLPIVTSYGVVSLPIEPPR